MVWYAGKFNDGEDFIGLNDVDLILVHLGKGVYQGTKEKPTHAYHPLPVPEITPARNADDEDYVPPIYDPESPTPGLWEHPRCWTVTKQSQHLRQPLQSQNNIVIGSQNKLL